MIDPIIKNLALFLCNTTSKICTQTYGYIKSSDTSTPKYYSFDINSSNANAEYTLLGTCAIGGMYTGGKLCFSTTTTDVGEMKSGNVYALSNGSKSVFVEAAASLVGAVIIRSNGYAFYLDTLYSGKGINLFAANTKITATSSINDNNETKLSIYSCSDEGICTAADGYVKNGSKYYNVQTTASSPTSAKMTDNDFKSNCSTAKDDGGFLLNDGSLCLGNESVEFLGSKEIGNYTIYDSSLTTKAYQYVRAIENVFIKSPLTCKF